jgi:hypothetical protein
MESIPPHLLHPVKQLKKEKLAVVSENSEIYFRVLLVMVSYLKV